MLKIGKKWSCIALISVMLLSSFGGTVSQLAIGEDVPGAGELPDADIGDNDSQTELEKIADIDKAKIQPSLQKRIFEETMVRVIIGTTNVGELGTLLQDVNYKGRIGTSSGRGLALPILEVPSSTIPKIASLDTVIGIYEYSTGMISDTMLEKDFEEPLSPSRAPQAWSNGFTGEGVKIGILDTGIDFAHPDLYGKVARVDDTSSPYDGWPIAYDPASMKSYMDSGGNETSGWYVNTTYNGTGPFEAIHTITLDGENDFSDTELANPSGGIDFPTADVKCYELTSFYVTRDLANWYMGFPTYANETNMSYGIYIDVDGTTSGSDEDPRGNYIDTKASHSDVVNAVAFSPDGSMIASGSDDEIIKIWDADGNIIKELKGHTNSIHSLAWAPNNTWLASADVNQLKIWDVSSGEEITGVDTGYIYPNYDLDGLLDPSGQNMLLSFSSDGSHVATGGISNYIRVYNMNTTLAYEILIPGAYAYSVAYNPDGTLLAAGFTDNEVRVFNTTSPNPEEFTSDCGSPVFSIAWKSDGTELAASLMDDTTRIWDIDNPIPEGNLTTAGFVSKVVWSSDDALIGTIVSDKINTTNNRLEIWDVSGAPATWAKIATLGLNEKKINAIDWFGDKIVSCADDTKVKTWDVSSADPLDWNVLKTFHWHLPDYVLYLDHTGTEWGIDSEGIVWSNNDTLMTMFLYEWTGSSWNHVYGAYNGTLGITPSNSIVYANDTLYFQNNYYPIITNKIKIGEEYAELTIVSGELVYSGFEENRFLELSIPRGLIGDPGSISVELFTVGQNESHAQDTVPSDINVDFNTADWKAVNTTLSNFADFVIRYYTVDNLEIVSMSGTYHYGNHPDVFLTGRYGSVGVLVVDSTDSGVYDKVCIDTNHDYVFNAPVDVWNETHNYCASWDDSWEDNRTFTLNYPIRLINSTLYYWNITTGWYKMTLSSEWANFTTGHYNYTINEKVGKVCLGWNATAGEEIHVFYNYTDVILEKGSEASLFTDALDSNTIDSTGLLYFIADGNAPIPYSDIYAERYGILEKKNQTSWEDFNNTYIPGNGEVLCFMGEYNLHEGKFTSHGTKSASAVLSVAPNVTFIPIGDLTDGSYFDALYFAVEGYDGALNSGDEVQIGNIGLSYPDVYETGWDIYSKFTDYISKEYSNETTIFVCGVSDSGYGYGTVSSPASGPAVIAVGMATDYWTEGPNASFGDVDPSSARGPTALGQLKPDVIAGGTVDVAVPLWNFGEPTTDIWQSPDASSAVTTGVLALIFDAHKQAFTSSPNASLARSILMSGCDDVNFDILSQGAGLVNASRATEIANGNSGLLITPSSWIPGDFEGHKYEGFSKLLYPGNSDNTTFTVNNFNSSSSSTRISDMSFGKIGEYTYSAVTQTTADSIWLMLNHTGIYNVSENELEKVDEIDARLWHTSTLLKVTAHANWAEIFDEEYEEILYTYNLNLYDWRDIISPPTETANLNTISVCDNDANILETRVHHPARRIRDGLMVEVGPRAAGTGGENILWTIVVDFYHKNDWDWVTTDKTTLTIGGDESGTFTATMNVPDDAGIGSYEGAIYINHDMQQITDEPVVEYPTFHVSDEYVAEYPTNHEDEQIANIVINDVTGESVGNTTDRIANLTHGNITGAIDLWKNGTIFYNNESMVYNTTGAEPLNGDGDFWFYLPHGNITSNLSLYYREQLPGTWDICEDFVIDNVTGNVTVLWGAPDPGWEFYAWYNYSASTLLSTPINYMLFPANGTIILSVADALQPGEFLTANYSWYEPISTAQLTAQLPDGQISACTLYLNGTVFANYVLNYTTGFITFTPPLGPGDVVNASYDWYVPTLIQSALLNHTNILPGSYTLYLNGTVFANYVLNCTTGFITFTPPLGPGDVVNASYDWYVPTLINSALLGHTNIVPSSWEIYKLLVPMSAGEYAIDAQSGTVIFTTALEPGDSITADYAYYARTTTLPVLVNVAADRVILTLGGPSTFEVTNELVTDVATNLVLDEAVIDVPAYARENELVANVPTHTIVNESVIDNIPIEVVGEFVLCSIGGEEEAWLDHGGLVSGGVNRIVDGTYTLYNNSVEMLGTEYTLNWYTGKITFTPALSAGCAITANYDYYTVIDSAYLAHGSATTQERIVPGLYLLYNGTSLLAENTDYTLDTTTGEITFTMGSPPLTPPLPVGAVITATYSYYPEISEVYFDFGGEMDEAIVPKSYALYNNSVKMIEGEDEDYMVDTGTGKITFTGSYDPLSWDAVITANYSYYYLVESSSFARGASLDEVIVGGSSVLRRFTSFNNESISELYDCVYYVKANGSDFSGFDLPNGNITNDTFLCMRKMGVFYTLELDVNYTVNRLTGQVTMISDDFKSLTSNLLFYAWYEYVEELSESDDYIVDPETGDISFIISLEPNDEVIANYSYYDPKTFQKIYTASNDPPYGFSYIQLRCRDIISGSYDIHKNTELMIEHTDYEIDLTTGIITFAERLTPSDMIYANYTYRDPTAGLYNNNGVFGGYGSGSHTGDWRYYYVNIPDQGLFKNEEKNIFLFFNMTWEHELSDINVNIFGKDTQLSDPITDETFSSKRYGAYTMSSLVKSDSGVYTATGTSQEILATPLVAGLNIITLRNTVINGTESHEWYSSEIGWLMLDSTSVSVTTTEASGKVSVNTISNVDLSGVNASVLGPAVAESFKDLEVWQECDEDMAIQDAAASYMDYFLTYRLASFQKIVKVEKASTFEVHIIGQPDDDLDLCIFYDVDNNGEIDEEDLIKDGEKMGVITYAKWGMGNYAGCADDDGDEAVKLISPPDGQYIIAVYGWGVKSGAKEGEGDPALFDMDISQIVAGIEGYGLEGSGEDTNPGMNTFTSDACIPAFTTQTFNVTWNFPGTAADGSFGGMVYIGPQNAPGLIGVLVTIVLDRESPEITGPLPSDHSLIRDNQPIIMATVEDLSRAEIDAESIKLYVDGIDITPLASISVELDDAFGGGGYPRGIVTYTPNGQLSEGGHSVELVASDWAGNEVTRTWAFTVDTLAPALTISSDDVTYVNTPSATLQGTVETGCDLTISGVQGSINQYTDGTFTATLTLPEEENDITLIAVDAAGNTIEVQRRIIYDTETPEFDRVVALDGATTNRGVTGIYGEMSERGTLTINGRDVAVNSDGSFWAENIELEEGVNQFTLEFTDLAGNVATRDMTITLDTIAPVLSIDAGDSRISTEWLNISGITDADATLYINGKLIDVSSTRQGTGEFEHTVRLSYGANTIVIESKDRAGNVAQEILSVSYELESGTNWGAIGLMIMLLVVGLFVGILITRFIFGIPAEEEEYDEELEGELEPEEGEEFPEMEEEMPEEELPEDLEEMPEEMGEEPEVEDLEEVPESDITDAEPIPDEEAFPEEFPETEEEIPLEDLPDEDLPEPDEADTGEPDEALDESATDAEPEAAAEEEDPRIAKLTQAFEDGKISKELYEKNLAKFKGE